MYKQDWKDGKARASKPTMPSPLPLEDHSLRLQFISYLASRGLSASLADFNGLYPTSELDGVPRVVIPATSTNTWPYYQARAMNNHPTRYRSPAVPRGDALIVMHPQGEHRGVLIVEGPFDALAAASIGYVGVGLMGNRPPQAVLHHLATLIEIYTAMQTLPCLVIPDADATQEAHSLAGHLWERGIKCSIKYLTGYKDLAAMSLAQRVSLFGPLTN